MTAFGQSLGLINGFGSGRRKVGFLGDSITIAGETYSSNGTGSQENVNAPGTYAMLQSARSSWDLIVNAGVGGQNSFGVSQRVASDIIAAGCDICVLTSFWSNDIGSGFTLQQSATNVINMIRQCLMNNVLPILCTPTPRAVGDSAAFILQNMRLRRLAIEIARQFNIPCIDMFSPIGDVTTGSLLATYSQGAGNVHPTDSGYKQLGISIAQVLDSLCLGNVFNGIESVGGGVDDSYNGQGFFLTNSGGIGTGWANGGLASGAVTSINADGTLGNGQRITTTATASNSQLGYGPTNISVGHVYELSGYISKQGTSTTQITLSPNAGGGARRLTYYGTQPDIVKARFALRWIPTIGGTLETYLLAGPGSGTCDWYRLALRDLTALGIA